MIKGNLKSNTVDFRDILSVVDEYDIYRYYLGYDFDLNKMYPSPFRSEIKGSFNIFVAKDSLELRHKDYGNGFCGNCFEFVCQLFNIDFKNALIKIASDLNIKFNNKFDKAMKITIKKELKERALIQFTTRPFTKEELSYWNQYGISEKQLKLNRVYPVHKLWINKQIMYNRGYIRFAYVFDGGVKIYSPYDPEYKWITNLPIDYMSNIDKLDNSISNICLVTKSKKCEMVISNVMNNVCSVQNESTSSINEKNIKYLQNNFDYTIINFDPDKTGVESSIYYNQYGFGYWNIDKELLKIGIKDASDYVKVYGYKKLQELLKNKGFIV